MHLELKTRANFPEELCVTIAEPVQSTMSVVSAPRLAALGALQIQGIWLTPEHQMH